jgi:hypothetical protein
MRMMPQSLFVGLMSILQIAVSVPFVIFVYRILMNIRYLGVLNG